ncbi:hypothetical protein TorRG33x02_109630 [Trema orientale]|uniref:Uncharacterized protein n=1 Tax=Trema orientale TaxID=63057 RepID=A0A2P5F5I9_TREOI|nr:hypothetical protein TorRG33x02_109630 [Trema orientale]
MSTPIEWMRRAMLIRIIEYEVSDASVSETLLDNLELIEKLKEEEEEVSDTMKSAYCAVALECTVKYFVCESVVIGGNFSSARERIWRARVTRLEMEHSKLFTLDLKAHKEELEVAITSPVIRRSLIALNTRNAALGSVSNYLRDAWTLVQVSGAVAGAGVHKLGVDSGAGPHTHGLGSGAGLHTG